MFKSRAVLITTLFVAPFLLDTAAQNAKPAPPVRAKPASLAREPQPGREYSGMYSFLKEGEFVQISVEEEGKVTGFLSRYGEAESGNGPFLEQYFRSGKLAEINLLFIPEPSRWKCLDSRARSNPATEKIRPTKPTTC